MLKMFSVVDIAFCGAFTDFGAESPFGQVAAPGLMNADFEASADGGHFGWKIPKTDVWRIEEGAGRKWLNFGYFHHGYGGNGPDGLNEEIGEIFLAMCETRQQMNSEAGK